MELYGPGMGALLALATYAPLHIMSFVMTPMVLQEFALSHAVAMKHRDVLDDMEREAEESGDYVGANE
eukprot:4921649-Prymnesium_polylepis.1